MRHSFWFLLPGLLSLFAGRTALAYPSYIGFGYCACLTCHFNPAGGGPLTDYGRALGATEVSGRLFVKSETTDEDLGRASGLFGPFAELPTWIRGQANYRGMFLATGLEGRAMTRWINMQAEASAILKFMDDKLIVSGTFGYIPAPAAASTTERGQISDFISREHYAGYRPMKSFGVYLGLLDVAFGIRSPDHNAYYRKQAAFNINDQTHGVMLHLTDKKYDGFLHAFVGNLYQDSDLRQKGASGMFEYELAQNFRLGGSLLASSGTFRSRQIAAVHARLGVGGGSSVLAELGILRNNPAGLRASVGDIFFLQTQTRLARGLFMLMTFEQFAADYQTAGTRNYRVGPSVDWFPFQRLELRVDFLGTRITGVPSLNQDIYTVQSQVHLWL